MRNLIAASLISLVSSASAVEVRVATFNIGAHFGESYFDYSLGDPGTPDHDTVLAILNRIDADVVALQEIHSVDLQGNPDDLDALAASAGYSHLFVTPLTNAMDTSLRVVILSKFPFLSTGQVNSPSGAKELTRLHPVVKVDIPGTTNDLTMISAHLKAGTTSADRFRRAVEMKRLTGHLASSGLTTDDNYVILGDFNPSANNGTFSTLPADLPGSYVLGSDITLPVTYSTNMLSYFTTPNAVKLDPRQLDNSASTYGTTFTNGPTLDLVMVSPAIAGRPKASEVYNSTLDTSNSVGLPKNGAPLASTTSATASDHYAVFADLEMDSDFPNLAMLVSPISINEGVSDGVASLTVTLPSIRANSVTVTLSSDDAAAQLLSPTVTIPAGSLNGNVGLKLPRNFLADSGHSVTFTATATGFDPASVVLQVNDIDGPYVFSNAGQTVSENFNGFDGTHDPAPWVSSAGTWQGTDDGTSSVSGLRAYGSNGEVALGFLPGESGSSASASFENQTGAPIHALQVSFDVEAWKVPANGAADGVSADLVIGAQVIPIPGLSFVASPSQAAGTVALTASVAGFSIPHGTSFELRISFNAGSTVGALPADVFVNEFHYDNDGTDVGEFVEVVVGPGFTGSLSNINVVLYNGNTQSAGVVYGTLNLATDFTEGVASNGFRIFSKTFPTDGLQNGPRDGFAVVNTATSQVLHFISYEGSFTASAGPASGLTASNVNLTQGGSDPVGMAAIGRSGTGGNAADFTWTKFTGIAHSPGFVNQGQTFTLPVLPHRGLAIDNLSVTLLSDSDQDGIVDTLDPDDDNDGQSDAYETAFGSNPFSAGSKFNPQFVRVSPGNLLLSFHGAAGISYTVETSADLTGWTPLSVHPGNGSLIHVPLTVNGARRFYRVSAPVPP